MVLKSCWGKGIATALIEALLERIQDTPFEQLELDKKEKKLLSILDAALADEDLQKLV